MHFFRFLLITLGLACTPMLCADVLHECQKIVVAGDAEWPPYTIVVSSIIDKDNNVALDLSGIGMDLASRIIAELDIPVEEYLYADQTQLISALRSGDVDLVVSAYDNEHLAAHALLLKPEFIVDPITVAVPINNAGAIHNWESLVGLQGIKDSNFVPDQETHEFFNSYLHVTSKGYLIDALNAVKNGQYKYAVGSDLQLTYAIQNNNLSHDLIVMKNLVKGGEVYMAFSKNSVCQPYAYYIRKRLQDYKNNDDISKLVRQYVH